MTQVFRAGLRAAAMIFWTGGMLALYGAACLASPGRKRCLPVLWHRGMRALAGVRFAIQGIPADGKRVLYLVNHVSYLDIVLLGGILDASFVAKAEIARWPVIGWLAGLQDTVFVERRATRSAGQRDELTRRLEKGDNLIVFPEGTSSDGCAVLPFRSALLDAAYRCHDVRLQPVSLAYTDVNGQPLDSTMRDRIAWYGDMELLGHLWRLLGLGRIGAVVRFHPVVAASDYPSRKELALACHATISQGVAAIASENRGPKPPEPDSGEPEPIMAVWPPFD